MSQTLLERLMAKTSPEPNSGCWLWMGAITRTGYGMVWKEGGMHLTHRVVYELYRGSIPANLVLDHLCRVRCCVNPMHLDAVDRVENLRRSPVMGKVHAKITHCPHGHPYDDQNTAHVTPWYKGVSRTIGAKTYRVCLACRRAYDLKRRPRGVPRNTKGGPAKRPAPMEVMTVTDSV